MDERSDVERRYYVYVHKDKESGTPFYVGKGVGRRAYETTRRNADWKKLLDGLRSGYEVEIVGEDLTEIDAYALECQLIKQYGHRELGGILVNKTAGGSLEGEIVAAISFPIALQATERTHYRQVAREEKLTIAKHLMDQMKAFRSAFDDALGDLDPLDDDVAFTVDGLIGDLGRSAGYLQRRKISHIDFCNEIEDALEDVESIRTDPDYAGTPQPLVDVAAEIERSLRSILAQVLEPPEAGNNES